MGLVLALRDRLVRWRERMACRDAVELMTDYLEDALAPRSRRRFETHLARCTACVAYLDQMRATVAALGHLRPDDLPAAVRAELVMLYRAYRG